MSFRDAIEVLGVEAKRSWGGAFEARTPLGMVAIYNDPDGGDDEQWWAVSWWPRRQRRVAVRLASGQPSPADAAREATRRLRAIMRTCARAGAL